METISEAYGTIFACAKKKEVLEAIALLLEVHQGGYYYIQADYDESIIVKDADCYKFETSLYGAGKWCFEYSVKHFFDWAWLEIDKLDPEPSKKLEAAFELLDKEAFELSFDFYDCERGANYLCEGGMIFKKAENENVSGGKTRDKWSSSKVKYFDPKPGSLFEYDFIGDYYACKNLDDVKRFLMDIKDGLVPIESDGSQNKKAREERVA